MYDLKRSDRPQDMPLPTLSFTFLLGNLSEQAEEEYSQNYPAIPVGAFEMYGLQFKVCLCIFWRAGHGLNGFVLDRFI